MSDEDTQFICLEEHHCGNRESLFRRGNIPGYQLLYATYDTRYGSAIYARANVSPSDIRIVHQSNQDSIEILVINYRGLHIINVYKPLGETLL